MQAFATGDVTGPTDKVSLVALQALSGAVSLTCKESLPRRLLESFVNDLYQVDCDPLQNAGEDVMFVMCNAQIVSSKNSDVHVPLLARKPGNAWVVDTLDFGCVTIGAVPLHGLVRRLGTVRGAPHTLGVTILAGQMCERGVFVHLLLELTAKMLREFMHDYVFFGVLLSIEAEEYTYIAAFLVACAEKQSRSTPVIIGGLVLDQAEHLMKATGADFAASDTREAMTFACIANFSAQAACVGLQSQGVLR